MRPRDRQVPDGIDRAAAVIHYRKNEKKPGLRFGCCICCGGADARPVVAVLRGAAFAATGRTSEFGAATVVSGAGFITGIGSVVVATIGSVPTGAMARRGHLKSSARPAGDAIASPLTSTRTADFELEVSPVSREPISSCSAVTEAVSGTTGPARGRAAGPLGLAATGAC